MGKQTTQNNNLTHHTHHAGHPQHQYSLPIPNQGRPRPMTPMNRPGPIGNPPMMRVQNAAAYGPRRQNRPGPIGNPNRPIGVQNVRAYGPRRQNTNMGYNGQPHFLHHISYAPTHSHHAGHLRHQNSLPVTNQASNRPRSITRPGPFGNPNMPIGVQNSTPRRYNNSSYNGQVSGEQEYGGEQEFGREFGGEQEFGREGEEYGGEQEYGREFGGEQEYGREFADEQEFGREGEEFGGEQEFGGGFGGEQEFDGEGEEFGGWR